MFYSVRQIFIYVFVLLVWGRLQNGIQNFGAVFLLFLRTWRFSQQFSIRNLFFIRFIVLPDLNMGSIAYLFVDIVHLLAVELHSFHFHVVIPAFSLSNWVVRNVKFSFFPEFRSFSDTLALFKFLPYVYSLVEVTTVAKNNMYPVCNKDVVYSNHLEVFWFIALDLLCSH